ncbi:Clp protease-domain-containing protein [Phellopilus nigrolimitatus]|nr:Clp protease-domain-containing protein [Phellopilus nigrolimitatus]
MLRNLLPTARRNVQRIGRSVSSRNFHPISAVSRTSTSTSASSGWTEPSAYDLVPMVIEQSGRGERSFDIFSRLLRERVVMLYGPVRDSVSAVTVSQLLFLEAEDSSKPIHMYINSPGGSVTAGLAIYDTVHLKCSDVNFAQYVSSPIHTYCVGQACSMGSLLLAAGEKGKRHCLPHASIMIHQPSGGASGQASDIAIHAREILRVREVLTSIYQRHCSHEGESIQEGMQRFEKALERDYFLTAKEALEFGLVDGILERRPNAEAEGR